MKKPDFRSHPTATHTVEIGDEKYMSMSLRLIMPGDLNAAGRLFGGRLMEWVDEIAALYCMSQLARKQIVTKKISEVIFNEPADLRDVLEFFCRIKNVGRTSVTIECLVMTKILSPGDRVKLIVACDLVFVSIDDQGRPEPHGYVHGSSEA
ncbi:MAG: acyl-CoA thioesterase [Silvanigrellaceae bacterium]